MMASSQARSSLPGCHWATRYSGALERVLDEVVGRLAGADERTCIATQTGQLGQDGAAVHHAQGFATRHTPLKPSPVRSPGFWSLTQKYSGLPLYAHCLPPSSRITTL